MAGVLGLNFGYAQSALLGAHAIEEAIFRFHANLFWKASMSSFDGNIHEGAKRMECLALCSSRSETLCRGCGMGSQATLRWLLRWWTITMVPQDLPFSKIVTHNQRHKHFPRIRAWGEEWGCAHIL